MSNIEAEINETLQQETLLVRMVLPTSRYIIPSVCALVQKTAQQIGISTEHALQMEVLTEELCLIVLEQAFPEGNKDNFDLQLAIYNDNLILRIETKGQPFDLNSTSDSAVTKIGLSMIKSIADNIRINHRGRQGIQVELEKRCIFHHRDTKLLQSIKRAPCSEPSDIACKDMPITVRMMRPDEASALARCMFRVYGLTYKDIVYRPELFAEHLLSESMVSTVATTADGEIVAHHALQRPWPQAPIAESTMGVVDPRFRGRGLLETLKELSFSDIVHSGVYGIYCSSVTIHPISQRVNYGLGGRETGIMLNYISGERHFRAISEKRIFRQATVNYYFCINENPSHTIYPPIEHRQMILAIYAHVGLRRSIADESDAKITDPQKESIIKVSPSSMERMAILQAIRFGTDFMDRVVILTKRLCDCKFDVIYIDLPLSNQVTPVIASLLIKNGFSFAGILPEYLEGDAIRFQYINSLLPPQSHISVYSDFAKMLLDYIYSDAAHQFSLRGNL